ncbi:hypothetical protein [Sphingomonas lycopersici]|uniref:Uncharacterized protein n=1 Tax=Sphingomonas lycopersici TaxID=2951807 RepID=A0AA41Z8Q2_9SPHN|nr:hypothetical protein [Sphingomonas lycopersici]MCW6536017.1 hypothetical protein [Sphingomonas lycopersici]
MKLATIERDAKINVVGIYGKVRMPRKCPGRSGRQAVLERYRELKMARSVDNFVSGAVADFFTAGSLTASCRRRTAS